MENVNVIEALQRDESEQAVELVELGSVSTRTQGGFSGHSLDGGFGFKKP